MDNNCNLKCIPERNVFDEVNRKLGKVWIHSHLFVEEKGILLLIFSDNVSSEKQILMHDFNSNSESVSVCSHDEIALTDDSDIFLTLKRPERNLRILDTFVEIPGLRFSEIKNQRKFVRRSSVYIEKKILMIYIQEASYQFLEQNRVEFCVEKLDTGSIERIDLRDIFKEHGNDIFSIGNIKFVLSRKKRYGVYFLYGKKESETVILFDWKKKSILFKKVLDGYQYYTSLYSIECFQRGNEEIVVAAGSNSFFLFDCKQDSEPKRIEYQKNRGSVHHLRIFQKGRKAYAVGLTIYQSLIVCDLVNEKVVYCIRDLFSTFQDPSIFGMRDRHAKLSVMEFGSTFIRFATLLRDRKNGMEMYAFRLEGLDFYGNENIRKGDDQERQEFLLCQVKIYSGSDALFSIKLRNVMIGGILNLFIVMEYL